MGSDFYGVIAGLRVTDFNPRSPRGERPPQYQPYLQQLDISIHAPRVGSDEHILPQLADAEFQSTLPAWGATNPLDGGGFYDKFQSTLPAWGATKELISDIRNDIFQSTLPAWGATQ